MACRGDGSAECLCYHCCRRDTADRLTAVNRESGAAPIAPDIARPAREATTVHGKGVVWATAPDAAPAIEDVVGFSPSEIRAVQTAARISYPAGSTSYLELMLIAERMEQLAPRPAVSGGPGQVDTGTVTKPQQQQKSKTTNNTTRAYARSETRL
jgi:hypothetical protein